VSNSFWNQSESTHHNLNRFNKASDFMWIDSHLSESIHMCIVSFLRESSHKTLWLASNRFTRSLNRFNLPLGTFESTQIYLESYHPSYFSSLSFCCLNRFKHLVNRFNLLFLCENLVLSPFLINSLLITPKALNHLHLFSLGLKNSLLIHSSRLNTFS